MGTEYLEATPQSRRRLIILFVLVLVVGVVLIEALEAYVDRTKALPLCDQIITFRWLWAAPWIGLVVLIIWVARLAQRSLKLNQWPLPDASVFHRTPVHRGSSAKWRAYSLFGLVGRAPGGTHLA